eukprot:Gb_27957 [translate_table: standard]
MQKQVIADEARSFGAAMAVIDPYKGTTRPCFHLALIFQQRISLDNGNGEITGRVMAYIFEPKKIVIIIPKVFAHAGIMLNGAPACRHNIYQPRKHPSSHPNTHNPPILIANSLLLLNKYVKSTLKNNQFRNCI